MAETHVSAGASDPLDVFAGGGEAEAERRHLHDLFEQAPAMIVVVRGPQHVIEVVNPPSMRTLGRRDPRELLGRPIREALPELERQGLFERLDQVYASGEPVVATEMPIMFDPRGDGSMEEMLVNFVYQPYRNAAGEIEGIMAHAVDVTEQVRARQRVEELARQLAAERDRLQIEAEARVRSEAALRASEERYRAIAETANEGIWLIDPDARTIFANARLAALLGTTVADVQARTVLDFVFEEDRSLAQERIGQNLAGQPEQFDFRFRRADGTAVEVLACTSPVRADDGAIVGALGMFSDITELREMERAREEFLSSAAHDLKTPLTGIRGHAQLARRRLARLNLPEGAPFDEHLAQIDASVARLLDLINELVDVTRAQLGQSMVLDRQPTDLVALVRGVMVQHVGLTEHRLRVERDLPSLRVSIDAARIERVVGNLLSNAIKYSPQGGEITLRVAREQGAAGPEAMIVVRDQGLGIPAADLPHIFDRFRRARNVPIHISGTGIGLASAWQIVVEHGGTIDVESQEGSGSTFTVRLPLSPSQVGKPTAETGKPTAEKGEGEA